jgi:hypothetical protein
MNMTSVILDPALEYVVYLPYSHDAFESTQMWRITVRDSAPLQSVQPEQTSDVHH